MAINWIPKIIYPSGGGTTITYTTALADDPRSEELKAFNRTSVSQSGIVQNSQDRIEETLTLHFRFVSETLTNSTRTWFENSGSNKTEFDFYEHESEAGFITAYLVDDTFKPRTAGPAGSGTFTYDFDIKIRRVI